MCSTNTRAAEPRQWNRARGERARGDVEVSNAITETAAAGQFTRRTDEQRILLGSVLQPSTSASDDEPHPVGKPLDQRVGEIESGEVRHRGGGRAAVAVFGKAGWHRRLRASQGKRGASVAHLTSNELSRVAVGCPQCDRTPETDSDAHERIRAGVRLKRAVRVKCELVWLLPGLPHGSSCRGAAPSTRRGRASHRWLG